jgi:hypothetical protein
MANTYTLIKGETLAGAQASYTFTSIPNTYTDLLIKWSARDDQANIIQTVRCKFNNSSVSEYSWNYLYNSAGSVGGSSSGGTSGNHQFPYGSNGTSSTSSTFTNYEVYIPNYAGSYQKGFSTDGVAENNSSSGYGLLEASLWANTSAITEILLYPNTGNFVQYSSFYLYGIKNS